MSDRTLTEFDRGYLLRGMARRGASPSEIAEADEGMRLTLPEAFDDAVWHLDHPRRRFRLRLWREEDGHPLSEVGLRISIVEWSPEMRLAVVGIAVDHPSNPSCELVHEDGALAAWVERVRNA